MRSAVSASAQRSEGTWRRYTQSSPASARARNRRRSRTPFTESEPWDSSIRSNAQHMMKGVQAAMKSAKTPSHLKPHLQNRLAPNVQSGNKPLSTMEPDDDELMDAAARTPDFDSDEMNEQAVDPMQESLGNEAVTGGLKRSVSRGGAVQIQRKRPGERHDEAWRYPRLKKVRKPKSAFMGEFGGRPKGF